MRRAVEEGGADVAFVLDGPVEASGLSVEPLLEEGVSVIAPAAHALASSTLVASRDLSGETVLLPEAPESGCAYRGMGVSVLPSVAVDAELEGGKLVALRWEEHFEVLTQMVWHKERWKSPASRAFLETAREVFLVAPVPIS